MGVEYGDAPAILLPVAYMRSLIQIIHAAGNQYSRQEGLVGA
jgi:hypothetical protein